MANTLGGNVWHVDTDNTTLADVRVIKAIQYVGAASGTVVIKQGTSSGNVLFKCKGTPDMHCGPLDIRCKDGIHIAITNSAECIIYASE